MHIILEINQLRISAKIYRWGIYLFIYGLCIIAINKNIICVLDKNLWERKDWREETYLNAIKNIKE